MSTNEQMREVERVVMEGHLFVLESELCALNALIPMHASCDDLAARRAIVLRIIDAIKRGLYFLKSDNSPQTVKKSQ